MKEETSRVGKDENSYGELGPTYISVDAQKTFYGYR